MKKFLFVILAASTLSACGMSKSQLRDVDGFLAKAEAGLSEGCADSAAGIAAARAVIATKVGQGEAQ